MHTVVQYAQQFRKPGNMLLDLSPDIPLRKGDMLRSDKGTAEIIEPFVFLNPLPKNQVVLAKTDISIDQLTGLTFTL